MSFRDLMTFCFWSSGLATLARRALTREGSFVLTFHGIAARRDALPAELEIAFDIAEFRATLDWVARHFAFLTPDELFGGKPGVLLTFDDGFANNHTNALPVLEDFEAPAVFFVTAQHVREPRDWLPATRETARRHWGDENQVPAAIAHDLFDGMSTDQFRACAEHPLITIGSHTVRHPFLTQCDEETLVDELAYSKELLETWCDRPVDLFAYPTGDYDLRVARAVRDAGYRAAFVEDTKSVGLPAYEIPRIDFYSYRTSYLAAKLSGLHKPALSVRNLLELNVPPAG